MKLLSRFNVSREKDGPRKFSLEMSMSGVISVGIVVVLGMCWVFILGILVGRGYRPEAAVPQIDRMMPTTEAKMPDNTTPSAPPTVLKPEELQFMEGLQGKDGEVVAESTQKAPADGKKSPALKSRDLSDAKTAPVAAPAVPVSRPAPQAPLATPTPVKAVPPAPHPAPETDARAAKTKVEPKSPFDKTARYTATYQVASFPGRDQAETLVRQLAKKGFTASVHEAKSNNSMVFRVNVQIKGTEADITDGLKKTGEKAPILLGKKPL
jgi:cell division septation protein DedD